MIVLKYMQGNNYNFIVEYKWKTIKNMIVLTEKSYANTAKLYKKQFR